MRNVQALDAKGESKDCSASLRAVQPGTEMDAPPAIVDMQPAHTCTAGSAGQAGGVAQVLTVELPFPDSTLMPNRKNGKHWSATHQAKGEAWKAGYYLTHEAAKRHTGRWHPTNGQVPITLTFCAPDRRKRDLDNLLAACKAHLDGVAAALLMDDREFEPVTLKRGDLRKGGAVVVEVGA